MASGTATIVYSVSNSCGSATATYNVRVKSTTGGGSGGGGGKKISFGSVENIDITIYPNPTHGNFAFDAHADGKLYLFTTQGNPVGEYKITEGVNHLTMPNKLPAGIYIGKFQGSDGATGAVRISYEP
jgi:hypothetical protein